jgi:hypothetical protein
VDRNDILTIQKERISTRDFPIGADKITSFEKHTRKTDFCNYVEVAYTDVEVTTTQVTAYEGYVSIDAGTQKTLTVDYGSLITDAFISMQPSAGIQVINFDSGVNGGKFTIKNNNTTAAVITVTIKGMSMSTSTQTVVATDEESIEAWGKQEYIYESSDLIQSYDRAQEIAELLLSRLRQGNGNVKISWRGDPGLGLQDTFVTRDRYGTTDKCVNEYNRYKFDGGLQQETRGRLLDGDVE